MTILEKILKVKLSEVQKLKESKDWKSLIDKLEAPKYSFKEALTAPGPSVIAEIKRASPSKGLINAELDPVKRAKLYEEGGARAISVLTDSAFFKGSAQDLKRVSESVKLPTLMKDFVIDEVQIIRARALGASSFLLIVAALSERELKRLLDFGRELKMEALVEVHNQKELEVALRCGAQIIGINNRDLKTFEVDINTTKELLPLVKETGKICVSESGIKTPEQVLELYKLGVDAFLIGETLVRSENPKEFLRRVRQ